MRSSAMPGQVCVAGSRLLVQASVHGAFVAELAAATRKMAVGNPLHLDTQVGAVNSLTQLEGNLGFVTDATREGGEVVTGGTRALQDTGGYYMDPTIVTGVRPEHRLYREEVFGPVLAVTAFENEAEALRLTNASDFGLAAGVWTANLSRAHRMIRGIRALSTSTPMAARMSPCRWRGPGNPAMALTKACMRWTNTPTSRPHGFSYETHHPDRRNLGHQGRRTWLYA